jgi:hypothetical protein
MFHPSQNEAPHYILFSSLLLSIPYHTTLSNPETGIGFPIFEVRLITMNLIPQYFSDKAGVLAKEQMPANSPSSRR